ncbi:MAG: NADPH-dependent FMN reductase [Steroidobacteraceae bacterium]|jgi:NAD(P)H-dependent FMN reductase
MLKLVGISGSLRQGSLNTALLRAAQEAVAAKAELEVRTLHGIPLYDADVEARDGIPESVAALKAAIISADGLLLVTPEYNHGIPGVFKNGIDWLSRPPSDIARVFGGKPVALMGASPGGFGTTLSQAAWLPTLTTLGMTHWSGGRLMLAHANAAFSEQGVLKEAVIQMQLGQFMSGFVDFTGRIAPRSA